MSFRFLTARRWPYTTLQKHAWTLRNFALRVVELRFSRNTMRQFHTTRSWSNTTSHNTPLRKCNLSINAVALTRKLYRMFWSTTRHRANTTKPVLYVIETDSCVKLLCYSNTVVLWQLTKGMLHTKWVHKTHKQGFGALTSVLITSGLCSCLGLSI